MQVTEILTDHTLMALDLQGTPEEPIRFYLDRMDQFDRAGIHWHWHPEVEFNVILRGRMEYYVENEHHTLAAGQGIFKNANILHMAQPARETPDAEMFSVILDPSFIAPVQSVIYRKYIAPFLGSQGLRSLVFSPALPWQQTCLDALRRAYALYQTKAGAYELHIHRLLCQVWQAMAEHAQELPRHDLTAGQRTDQVRAKQMMAFLQTHFREKLTLDLLSYRLSQAAHLLLTSDLPVAQVAEACGLGDASYFGKCFRRKTGLSPSQYRRETPGEGPQSKEIQTSRTRQGGLFP